MACGRENWHEDWFEDAPDMTPDPRFINAAASREKWVVKLQFDVLGGMSDSINIAISSAH
jgi:hypothetical protein